MPFQCRFCRRSSDFNAELKHIIDKGSLHLFVITVKTVGKNQEILLPPETCGSGSSGGMGSPQPPLQSISADLREISKMTSPTPPPPSTVPSTSVLNGASTVDPVDPESGGSQQASEDEAPLRTSTLQNQTVKQAKAKKKSKKIKKGLGGGSALKASTKSSKKIILKAKKAKKVVKKMVLANKKAKKAVNITIPAEESENSAPINGKNQLFLMQLTFNSQFSSSTFFGVFCLAKFSSLGIQSLPILN